MGQDKGLWGEGELSVDALYGRADGPFWKPLQRAIKGSAGIRVCRSRDVSAVRMANAAVPCMWTAGSSWCPLSPLRGAGRRTDSRPCLTALVASSSSRVLLFQTGNAVQQEHSGKTHGTLARLPLALFNPRRPRLRSPLSNSNSKGICKGSPVTASRARNSASHILPHTRYTPRVALPV